MKKRSVSRPRLIFGAALLAVVILWLLAAFIAPSPNGAAANAAPTETPDGASLTSNQKWVLTAMEYPSRLTLEADETYQLTLPFLTNGVSYTSDNRQVAIVDDDGTVTPVSDGMCIITAETTDKFVVHTVVTVTGTGVSQTSDPYAAYTQEGFDPETIKTELETYGSIEYGFVIREDLLENDQPTKENPFTTAYGHSGCEVKYKLLTTLYDLYGSGCEALAVEVEQTDTQIICRFYTES